MEKENFRELQINKKQRKNAIQKAVEEFTIQTQDELVEILLKEYGIHTNQATISRDIKELKLEKDDETRSYILSPIATRNKKARELSSLLQKSEATQLDMETASILLKVKPDYTSLVASQIEEFLHADGIDVWIFIGQNGAIILHFPKKEHMRIKSHLTQIFNHVNKKKQDKQRK